MVEGSEKAGKVQRLVVHSSQEEQNMGATVGQNDSQNNKGNLGFEQKNVQDEIWHAQNKDNEQG
jgi:hypothetical protein